MASKIPENPLIPLGPYFERAFKRIKEKSEKKRIALEAAQAKSDIKGRLIQFPPAGPRRAKRDE